MASGTDLESGNPLVTIHTLTRQVQRHALFVTLVRLDRAMQPVPYFARRWSWNPTRTALTLTLAHDLRWHDGVPTTAHDVAFTLTAVRDPALGAPRATDFAQMDSVRAHSDTTVTVWYRTPQSSLPLVLAELPIVPRHLLDTVPVSQWRANSFARTPVGNGPFRFVDRTPGRRWRFAANPDFPTSMGGPPKLRQLVVAVVDEAATKFAGLVSGELDIAGVSPTMASLVTRDPTLRIITPPALFSMVLAFNTTRPPFDDTRVRRAIAFALDRPRVVQVALAGYATPAGGAIPPGLPTASTAQPRLDVATADSLLDAAGWTRPIGQPRAPLQRNGRPLTVELLTVGSGDMAMEQLVQADLAARGITVRIRVAEQGAFLSAVRATRKEFDVAITGIPGDLGSGQLSALFDSGARGGALDYTGFHRPDLDSLLRTARQAPPERAVAAWHAVDAFLQVQAPVVWLYHARGVQGLSNRLEQVTMDLRGELVSVAQWTRREQP